MGEYTPKRNLYKPDIGETGWGDKVNQNWDILDTHTHERSEITDFFNTPFWENIPDKPSEYPPSKHALSHELGGEDEIPSNDILLRLQRLKGIFWFNNNWRPSGIIGYLRSGSASIAWDDFRIGLQTGSTEGSYAHIFKSSIGLYDNATWSKKRYFAVYALFYTNSAQIIHIVSGYISDPKSESNTQRHIGFKVVDDTIYGTVGNGSNESVIQLETIPYTKGFTLECVLYPNEKVEFYVSGVKKGEITENIPTGTSWAHNLFRASICNKEASNKRLDIHEVRILQME